MKYGFVFPGGEARVAADFAQAAEEAGWDGFFVWEPVWGVDAWVSLTAAAMVTQRIRLGTMITPVSRMRPWKLASETATLDRLSNGRVILSVGLGALDSGFAAFGEVTEPPAAGGAARRGPGVLTRLWAGRPVRFEGKHYSVDVDESNFLTPPPPPPVQQPRIPIWVVGAWPRRQIYAARPALRRLAAQRDGGRRQSAHVACHPGRSARDECLRQVTACRDDSLRYRPGGRDARRRPGCGSGYRASLRRGRGHMVD